MSTLMTKFNLEVRKRPEDAPIVAAAKSALDRARAQALAAHADVDRLRAKAGGNEQSLADAIVMGADDAVRVELDRRFDELPRRESAAAAIDRAVEQLQARHHELLTAARAAMAAPLRAQYVPLVKALDHVLRQAQAADALIREMEEAAVALFGTVEARAARLVGGGWNDLRANPSGSSGLESWRAFVARELSIELRGGS